MSHTFKVGEIAIVHFPGWDLHGSEVTIVGPLKNRCWTASVSDSSRGVKVGDLRSGLAYKTHHGAEVYMIRPEFLRKRRPPQDWVKLCNLHDIPREVSHV